MEVSQHSTSQGTRVDNSDEGMDLLETEESQTESNNLDDSSFTESLSQNETFQEATLIATIAETFGLTKFKPFQKEIKATLDGKDTVVIHTTGSGKSLFPISSNVSAKESHHYFTHYILNAGSSNEFNKQRD